ncbi:hypothetical protein FOXYSP1_08053 [Fusarium oxysporum f. sp. phaseoli]
MHGSQLSPLTVTARSPDSAFHHLRCCPQALPFELFEN